ncbi:MAG: cadherin-like beta sandwich domain-containing protein, partial [Spirochaetes bacterium]|nr:cadherin-like beta sandwich domain-containing protein [Spirochaetota bacterium]
ATININSQGASPQTVTLGAAGTTTDVDVVVTAQNGTTTLTYTLHVVRPPDVGTDSSLSALGVSDGTLSPSFDPGTLAYSITVGYCTNTLTVTPTTNDPMATIDEVEGDTTAPYTVDTSGASGTINIIVRDEAGTGTTEYTIDWAKASAPNVNLAGMTNNLHRASGTEPKVPFNKGYFVYSYTDKYDQDDSITYPFDPDQLEWTIVSQGANEGGAHTQETIHLGATLAAPSEATMTINGTPCASGSAVDIVVTAGGYNNNGNVLSGTQPTAWVGTGQHNIRSIQIVVTGNPPNDCVTKTYTVNIRLLNIYEQYYGTVLMNSEYERLSWGIPPVSLSSVTWTKHGDQGFGEGEGTMVWSIVISGTSGTSTQNFTNYNPGNQAHCDGIDQDFPSADTAGVDFDYRVPYSDGAARTNGGVTGGMDMSKNGTFTSTGSGLTLTHPSGMPLCTFVVHLDIQGGNPAQNANSYYDVTYMGITKHLMWRTISWSTGRTAMPYDLYMGVGNAANSWYPSGTYARPWTNTDFPSGTAAP